MSRAQLTSTVEQNTGGAVAPFVAGKNKIINGDFGIWQRGTSSANPSSYFADRWTTNGAGANITFSQQTTGAPTGSRYISRATLTGTGYYDTCQYLETSTASFFWGQTVTFSIKLRCNSTLNNTGMILKIDKSSTVDAGSGATWTNIGSTSVPLASLPTTAGTSTATWYTATVTAAVPADGTANSLRVNVQFNGTAPSGSIVEYAQAQLEQGPVATPFTTASGTLQGELALCERYYWRVATGANQPIINMAETNTTAAEGVIQYPVTMRTTPTLDQSTGSPYFTFLHAGLFPTFNNFVIDIATPNAAMIYTSTLGSSGTAGHAGMAYTNNANAYFGFQAEL